MPRLSLYRSEKQNDYRFLDRTISEQFTIGGTDLYIHKYLGPTNQGPSSDYTQPEYDSLNPTNIQDLLFLENRDRTYDTNIYRLRGHYNVQNLDFDLSQFGLFLNNDIIFITVHYNNMIDLIGRKLIVGDVLELPHLLDYNPLDETIPVALKRFYQITDANFASEGFSQTWYPHLWRIKCEPLVNSQEFSQILQQPTNTDNYLGIWNKGNTYSAGYVISFGDKNYIAKVDVPVNISPPNDTYWELDTAKDLADILGRYNQNIKTNNAILEEAKRLLPKSGYNNTNLYVVPTYGEFEENGVLSGKYNQPAPPINLIKVDGPPVAVTGTIQMIRNTAYRNASPVLRISSAVARSMVDASGSLLSGNQINLRSGELLPTLSDTGSGSLQGDPLLIVSSMGVVTGPYGTADNTYATADQDPTAAGFIGTVTPQMNYRADCDPRFQYILRATPRSFGYSAGYLTGDGQAPNGLPAGAGISFPQNPQVGDYFLRIDYFPQVLFRWNGDVWVRISENVRTESGFTSENQSLLSGFINNSNVTSLTNGTTTSQAKPLSTILTIAPDPIPPVL
jgi:hypothetical protein